jgi:hypothetical protein
MKWGQFSKKDKMLRVQEFSIETWKSEEFGFDSSDARQQRYRRTIFAVSVFPAPDSPEIMID